MTLQASGRTGSGVYYEVHGRGKPLFLSFPIMASHADIFPGGGAVLDGYLERLTDRYSVLLADYPSIGKSDSIPPGELTADRVCADLLAVAEAAGFGRFAFWGYSWGAAAGLQLACRSDRLTALLCGGWPALGGPYADMLRASASQVSNPPGYAKVILRNDAQYAQWVTFYTSVMDWPEAEAVAAMTCPRLNYVGAESVTDSGGIAMPFADLIRRQKAPLEALGWEVTLIPGAGHSIAMEPERVVPVAREFLDRVL